MNLRVYLRLLQPIPALVFSAVLANGAAAFGTLFFGLKRADAWLLALLVALPLLLGMDLASAAHTAMHRPFFPLLPDASRRLRRATSWAAVVIAVILTAAVAWFFPAVPAVGVFGLALPLLLLPSLNRRHLVAQSPRLHLSINLGGLQFPALGFAGWVLFMWLGAHRLVPAVMSAPWLFFAIGITAAVALARYGFSTRNLRERAATPFSPTNAVWSSLFHPQVMARAQAETRQHLSQPGCVSSGAMTESGRDWTVNRVGPRTRDWLRVLWHATYGVMPRGSFLRAQVLIFLVLLGYALVLPAIGFLFALLEHRPFGVAGYLEALGRLGTVELDAAHSAAQGVSILIGLMLYLGFTFVLVLATQLHPQLPYPVSRERLARVSFRHALLQLFFALAIPTAALQLASLVGQVVSGQWQPAFGVAPLLRLDVALLPLLLCVAFRLPVLVLLAAAVCVLVVPQSFWLDRVISLPGLGGIVLASAAALQLLRWQIRRHYATCDLVSEAGLARTFLLGIRFKLTPAPVR